MNPSHSSEGPKKRRDLIELTDSGLYCPLGDFYVDPWKPVKRAFITHGHADHARVGHETYYSSPQTRAILLKRFDSNLKVIPLEDGQSIDLHSVRVSLHPAGHILGSSQVRIESAHEVWVASGDYKRDVDPSCRPFEVVPCDTLISEATFALPIYQWRPIGEVIEEILQWAHKNRERGMNSVLCCYSLGKAQRILAEMKKVSDQTVYLHGAMTRMTELYREEPHCVPMVSTLPAGNKFDEQGKKQKLQGELILAPPSASGSPWVNRFAPYEVGFASGWMKVRGNRRRKAYDRGFVISDHADWPSLLRTIRETQAKRVIATHGFSDVLARYVREEMGLEGTVFRSDYGEEEDHAKEDSEKKRNEEEDSTQT